MVLYLCLCSTLVCLLLAIMMLIKFIKIVFANTQQYLVISFFFVWLGVVQAEVPTDTVCSLSGTNG